MGSLTTLRFLRPYLHHDILPVKPAAYARLFSSCYHPQSKKSEKKDNEVKAEGLNHTGERIKKLNLAGALQYPRIEKGAGSISVKSFSETCIGLPLEGSDEDNILTLHGKNHFLRRMSRN